VATWYQNRKQCRTGFTELRLFPLIRPYQLPFGENVTLHCGFDIFVRRAGFEVEQCIERVELEEIAMRAPRQVLRLGRVLDEFVRREWQIP
jgi:hypothetical protein